MRRVESKQAILETEGLTFHVATLRNVIPDAPQGVFVDEELLKQNPVLEKVDHGDIRYWFVAIDPVAGVPEGAPIHALLALAKQNLPNKTRRGLDVPIEVYAEWKSNYSEVEKLLEETIDEAGDLSQVRAIAHKLLQEAYEYSYDFINMLRRKYLQYWLLPPEPDHELGWGYLLYYSIGHQSWYSIIAADDFSIKTRHLSINRKEWQSPIIFKAIEDSDIGNFHISNPEKLYSFAEEMIATALVELARARLRSAIVHAIIALESSARNGLSYLLRTRLGGLEQSNILDVIAKEISIVTLAQVVYVHRVTDKSNPPIDWIKIRNLYNTRNTIVHKSQRRLRDTESIKVQILEIFRYVHDVESELQ